MFDRNDPLTFAIRFHDEMVARYDANRQATEAGLPLPTDLGEVLRMEDDVRSHAKALRTIVNQAFDDEREGRTVPAPHPFMVSNILGSTWRMLVSSAIGKRGSAPPQRFEAA